MSLPEQEVLDFFRNLGKGNTFKYKEVGSESLIPSKFCEIDSSRSCPGVKVIVHIPHECLIFRCRQKTKGFAFLQRDAEAEAEDTKPKP